MKKIYILVAKILYLRIYLIVHSFSIFTKPYTTFLYFVIKYGKYRSKKKKLYMQFVCT